MPAKKLSDKIVSKAAGGHARAAKLSKVELSEAASMAAKARWAAAKGVPKADYAGTIMIGDIELDCAVVEIDGSAVRLLSERSVTRAIGGKRGGAHWRRLKQNENGANFPVYLSARNLKPFITSELEEALTSPVQYLTRAGTGIANGVEADVLPKILWVYQDAMTAGKLLPSQAHLGEKARIILKALSGVTMVALVDEATGYQDVRAKDALSKILEQYISDEVQRWTKTFPERFYQEMFRLRGWEWTEKSILGRRPQVVGKYTDDIVYDRLAPGVREELRRKNPKLPSTGRRKHKHHQWLTGEVGNPRLMAHLEGVTLLMRQSKTWDELKEKLDEFYPIHEITEMGLTTNVRRKKIGGRK